ncbi:serine--tRNA ligase [Candidatus Dojkabacteria bacterium]|uniref:Serine--tRNA ligase n=1 Tax=Candidatus Dojkabacteria bacterium TaxID=2099670 RepID=A0A955RL39_9BACT|nr:serine--tRNA ligase [Candidatus Dojkabacteria bacterium]
MIDPNFIRQNPEKVKTNTTERGNNPDVVDAWLETDRKRNELIQAKDEKREERNSLSKNVQGKPDQETIDKVKALKEEIDKLESELASVEEKWNAEINQIPNIHFDDVPKGKSEDDNVDIEFIGEKPEFDFEPKSHLDLMTDLGIIDFEIGAKVSGSQFYYLKGDAVLLEYALIQFGLHKFIEKGYQLFQTPDLAKSRYYLGTGYAPKGDEAQTYEIEGEDLGLIATAEVTMAGYHADEIFDAKDLPKKYVAISHCYRKEAGAYGKYSKGLYRIHQFTKMEMFAYCTEEQSEAIHKEMLEIEKEIATELGIPFKVIQQCTADLGAIAAKKFDLEAWMPGRRDYGEITSTSNCTDYQARNLNIRYKDINGNNKYAHMLNGTAIALSRFPIAIIENYQQADGSIKIPEVLQKYMGKEVISK